MTTIASSAINMEYFRPSFNKPSTSNNDLNDNARQLSNLSDYGSEPSCSNASSSPISEPLPQLIITQDNRLSISSPGHSPHSSISSTGLSPGPQYPPHLQNDYDNFAMVNDDDEEFLSNYFDQHHRQKPIKCTGILRLDQPDYYGSANDSQRSAKNHRVQPTENNNNTWKQLRNGQNNDNNRVRETSLTVPNGNNGNLLAESTTVNGSQLNNPLPPPVNINNSNSSPSARKFTDKISVALILFIAFLWLLIAIVDIKTPLLINNGNNSTTPATISSSSIPLSMTRNIDAFLTTTPLDISSSSSENKHKEEKEGLKGQNRTGQRQKFAIGSGKKPSMIEYDDNEKKGVKKKNPVDVV